MPFQMFSPEEITWVVTNVTQFILIFGTAIFCVSSIVWLFVRLKPPAEPFVRPYLEDEDIESRPEPANDNAQMEKCRQTFRAAEKTGSWDKDPPMETPLDRAAYEVQRIQADPRTSEDWRRKN